VSQDELIAALRGSAGEDAAEIAAEMQTVALDGRGKNPRDDITILVLRVPERV
jgi:serine phosphatase RsbU (regulator of sigma subunit)